jgi:hypothetical protein
MPAVPGYFVIQANVKKAAKMNAVPTPTQIHIVPVSPCAEKALTLQPYRILPR